ncbi:MAG TPA: selenocysteine-specific translation elongation factor [Terriglobales bacterium]|jgi:selenocysteine-specific elongation factor|nr:selenocysteine-specific translation elongation factor [Terriglobales bacterium]
MKSVIVGTAGHIDHGKTALVKAVTGIDADRLEEEKRRGITIDLGFAHLEIPAPDGEVMRFGFVDVPGHERFVRNMLAGVGGIDLVLLVIAADEGIKPQTREHFDICRLLSVQRGMTLLTKSDLVDQDTLDVVRMEIEDLLRGSFLQDSPILPVSSLTGSGIGDLKRELVQMAATLPARDTTAIARLPIDRVFTMKGFGTVVTGTLLAGNIRPEDELEMFPSGRHVRVRGVQVHGDSTNQAMAGERTALNLAGVEKTELARGMTLSSPGLLQATSRIDVRLSLLASAKPLKNGARVHLHAFASETIASVRLLEGKQVQPGSDRLLQLQLADSLLLLPGDRFIVRQFSPLATIGGGSVLENRPAARFRNLANYREFLESLSDPSPESGLRARVIGKGVGGLTMAEAVARTGWRENEITSVCARIPEIAKVRGVLIAKSALDLVRKGLFHVLENFHKEDPLAAGLSKEALRERLKDISPDVFSPVFDDALKNRQIALNGDLVHLPGRGVEMQGDEVESRKTIEQAFASAGLKVPALKDVVSGLQIDKARAQKIVTLLLREKLLIKVSDDLVFHRAALDQLRTSLTKRKQKDPKIDVAGFKDLTGVSRKYAIPLLEYLDRERVTKRIGDERLIL